MKVITPRMGAWSCAEAAGLCAPAGRDSFAVAAALGAAQQTTVRERLRISLVFVIFEGGMPLIGLVLGSVLARGIGHVADYLAAAGRAEQIAGIALILLGAWLITEQLIR
jgi:putative Mn2+ efflux pump MntP